MFVLMFLGIAMVVQDMKRPDFVGKNERHIVFDDEEEKRR